MGLGAVSCQSVCFEGGEDLSRLGGGTGAFQGYWAGEGGWRGHSRLSGSVRKALTGSRDRSA